MGSPQLLKGDFRGGEGHTYFEGGFLFFFSEDTIFSKTSKLGLKAGEKGVEAGVCAIVTVICLASASLHKTKQIQKSESKTAEASQQPIQHTQKNKKKGMGSKKGKETCRQKYDYEWSKMV